MITHRWRSRGKGPQRKFGVAEPPIDCKTVVSFANALVLRTKARGLEPMSKTWVRLGRDAKRLARWSALRAFNKRFFNDLEKKTTILQSKPPPHVVVSNKRGGVDGTPPRSFRCIKAKQNHHFALRRKPLAYSTRWHNFNWSYDVTWRH